MTIAIKLKTQRSKTKAALLILLQEPQIIMFSKNIFSLKECVEILPDCMKNLRAKMDEIARERDFSSLFSKIKGELQLDELTKSSEFF